MGLTLIVYHPPLQYHLRLELDNDLSVGDFNVIEHFDKHGPRFWS